MVQVFGGCFARMNFVFHAIQTRHHQGRKAKIRVHQWIRKTRFNTPTLGVGHVRNTNGCRTVFSRIGQLDRCFIARNQPLVAVGTRVGDGVQRAGMLDDAADVIQRKLRQTCITVACKQVFAVFPDGLVNVHARAVVAHDGLGHESRGLSVGVGHVVHDILQNLCPVGTLDQCAEACADFILTGTRNFMVEHFNRNAQRFKNQRHFSAHVLRAVHWWHGEIPALDSWAMAAVAAFELFA